MYTNEKKLHPEVTVTERVKLMPKTRKTQKKQKMKSKLNSKQASNQTFDIINTNKSFK